MRSSLWLRWTINCALGELLGIAIAGTLAYAVTVWIGEPQDFSQKILVLCIMMFAGFIEGGLLGFFQWKVLCQKFALITQKAWMTNTILIAVVGWFLGMLPSLFFIPQAPSPDAVQPGIDLNHPFFFALLSILTGLSVGALFGTFQWFVLKRHAESAWKWIFANTLGWSAGLGWIYLFASLPTAGMSMIMNILFGISGGILAGLSVGAITGVFLVQLKPLLPDLNQVST